MGLFQRFFHASLSTFPPFPTFSAFANFYVGQQKKLFLSENPSGILGKTHQEHANSFVLGPAVINTHTLFGVLPVYLLTAMQDASRLIDPRDPPRHQRVGATLYGQAQASACCLSFSTDCEHVTEQDTTGWASDTAGCWVSTSPSG